MAGKYYHEGATYHASVQPHPGFAAVQKKIAGKGYGMKAAGAILAASSRNASAKAKKKNPRLKKVYDSDNDND